MLCRDALQLWEDSQIVQWLNDLKAAPTPKAMFITNDFQFLTEAGRKANDKRSEGKAGRCLHPHYKSCPIDWSCDLLKEYNTEVLLTFGSEGKKESVRCNHRKECVRFYC